MFVSTVKTITAGSTPIFMARILNLNGQYAKQEDFSSITVSVSELREAVVPVENYINLTIPITTTIYDELQLNKLWTEDGIGYNFLHFIPQQQNYPFNDRRKLFLVEYKLTFTNGVRYVLAFRVRTV